MRSDPIAAFDVIQVGVGEASWAAGIGRLSTFGLGSCVAVAIHDPVVLIGGLLHFQLATGALDPQRAARQPFLFADTGLCTLSGELARAGAIPARCTVHLVGGAQMLSAMSAAQIGKKNVLAARKQLWQLGYLIEAEVVGGTASRSISLDVAHGAFAIHEHERNP
jgi:chemotaxis protein CheD